MSIVNFLEQLGYDVKVRNRDFASMVRSEMQAGDSFLDAGCGDFLIGKALPEFDVMGVDIAEPRHVPKYGTFSKGSILCLPFGDRAFSFAGSLDVIEHLRPELRGPAIDELVRTATKGVIVGFPFKGPPEEIDIDFYNRLERKQKEVPAWLREHLAQSYPQIDEVVDMIRNAFASRGEKVAIAIWFSESILLTTILRRAAVHSGHFYIFANLILGLTLPIHLGRRTSTNSYRALIVARTRQP